MLALAQPSTLQELWVFFPLKLHWPPPWLAHWGGLLAAWLLRKNVAGSPICVASASCCNSGMLGGLCARQSHHIAHPRYSAGKIKLRTSVTCCPCPDPAWVLCCPRCTCSSLVLTHGLGAFSLVMPRRPLSGDLSIWYFDLLLGWRQVNKGLKNPFPPAS